MSNFEVKLKTIDTDSFLTKVTQIILLIAVIFTLGLRLWGIDKGFDITDEGYCLLGFHALQERFEVITSFHTIGYKLFGWMNPGIITYRLIALIITITSSLIFAVCFWNWLHRFYDQKNQVWGLMFTSLFLVFGGFILDYDTYHVLSYNTLNNAANLLQASLVFFTISQDPTKALKSTSLKVAWIGIGYSSVFQFFIKPPSSVNFLCLLFIITLLYHRKVDFRYYFMTFSCLITGCVIGALSYFTIFQDVSQYIELLSQNLSTNYAPSSDSPKILSPILLLLSLWKEPLREYKGLLSTSNNFLWFYLSVFLFSTIYFSTQYLRVKKNRYLFWILISGLSLDIIYHLYQGFSFLLFGEGGNRAITPYYVLVIAFLLIILMARFWEKVNFQFLGFQNDRFWQALSACLFLFFLPFIAGLGTDTSVTTLAAKNIVPWFALIIILLVNLNRNGKAKPFISLFMVSVVIWLLLKITYWHIYKPYRLVEPLPQQTEIVNLAQFKNSRLKVDPQTKDFIQALSALIKQTNFQLDDPIIALYDMPGIVYLLGGVSPGAPWYLDYGGEFESSNRICNNIMSSKKDKQNSILLVNSRIRPEIISCMKVSGIDFPDNYDKVGEVSNIYKRFYPFQDTVVSVWAPKTALSHQ